jgi:hypothetical protein
MNHAAFRVPKNAKSKQVLKGTLPALARLFQPFAFFLTQIP